MKHKVRPKKARRGTSSVFAIILIIIIIFAFGIVFMNFVMSEVNFAKDTFNVQMASLLLKSFTINATHIVAYLQNVGTSLVEITNAYVNGLIATLSSVTQIEPNSIVATVLQGIFAKGETYTIKLAGPFNILTTFKITY